MAKVLISDTATSLSTVNGFLQCEAYNLALQSTTTLSITNAVARVIDVTFANAGNCQGVVLSVFATPSTVTTMRGLTASLQESLGTATVTIASPGVVTRNTHGLAAGDAIAFSTTGALPTGITANLTYFVIATGLTANTFQFSTTAGGAAVNTSGSQSGTHTLWVTRASKALTGNQICNSVARPIGGYIKPFEFATPYAVDTTASKWRFHVLGDTSGTNNWTLNTSNGTAPFYATWCDTASSFTNGDVVIVKETVTVDQSATLTGTIANNTGDSTGAVAAIFCTNSDPTVANVANFVWENPAAAAYTLTVNGVITVGAHSGMRAGTSASRISYANMGHLLWNGASDGTLYGFKSAKQGATAPNDGVKGSLFFYGEIPSVRYDTLASDAATAQANLTTVNATGWANGDVVYAGKQDVISAGDVTRRTINTCVGTAIGLSSNLLTATRKAGGIVMRMNGYGFKISGPTGTALSLSAMSGLSNCVLSGVQITDHVINTATSTVNNSYDDAANRSTHTFEDMSVESTSTSITRLSNQIMLAHDGVVFRRIVSARCGIYGTCNGGVTTTGLGPGNLVGDDWKIVSPGAATGTDTSSKIVSYTLSNITIENSGTNGMLFINGAKATTLTSSAFWGSGGVASSTTATLMFGTTQNARLSGNSFNRCALAMLFNAVPAQGIVDVDSAFGNGAANTVDVDFVSGALVDYELRSPTGNVNIVEANLPNTINGTLFRVPDYNDTPDDDRVWATYGRFRRCKAGLADTTVRTAGGSSLRFEPYDENAGVNPLEWSEIIPTGNIQNKTMTLSVWVKINTTGYDAGVNIMPTMTVDYDNGTEVTGVAGAIFGSFQQIAVTFTPSTTYGQVTKTISGATDASTTDAYFYIDDSNTAFPAGHNLDLGSMDLFARGFPITPTIATSPNAASFWDALLTSHTISGSFGAFVKKLLTVGKFIGLK